MKENIEVLDLKPKDKINFKNIIIVILAVLVIVLITLILLRKKEICNCPSSEPALTKVEESNKEKTLTCTNDVKLENVPFMLKVTNKIFYGDNGAVEKVNRVDTYTFADENGYNSLQLTSETYNDFVCEDSYKENGEINCTKEIKLDKIWFITYKESLEREGYICE